MNAPVLTVTQLTNAIKHCLESTFPLVWLQGEISNFKQQTSGHLYFSLKDANAQISAVMFRGDAATLQMMPKGGEQVLVRGELNIYPAKGNYQLIVRELSYAGVGELLLKLEQLKVKLHKMGWFSKAHKKPLPKFPKRIGVVTSPTGAVIQDILNVLSRRFSGFHLILNPVKVQGEGAAQEIATAITDFNKYQLADVLIVGRGGGSLEDLWAFNEEIVAEAIFNSQIPIISAVGHETDHCIADYVADVRAPTPSAAAEIVIAEKATQLHHLQQIQHRLQQSLTHLVKHSRQRLKGIIRHPLFITSDALLGESFQRMDHLREDVDQAIRLALQNRRLRLQSCQRQLESLKPTTQLNHSRQRLLSIHKHLNFLWVKALSLRQERLENLANSLISIDPKNLLQRGYSILLSKQSRQVISSVAALQLDQQVQILLSDGEAVAKIEAVP